MYQELLEEFEQKLASGEDVESFAAEVLEKEALWAAVGSIGKGLIGGAARMGGKLGKGAFGLAKKNFEFIKKAPVLTAAGAGLSLAVGEKPLNVVGDTLFPALANIRMGGQELKAQSIANKLPAQMVSRTAEITEEDLEKLAAGNISEFFKTFGVPAMLGTGTFVGLKGLGALLERKPTIIKNIVGSADKAVGSVGKSVAKSMTQKRPFANVGAKAIAMAGKSAAKADSYNFDTITGLPPVGNLLKGLGSYLGAAAGFSVLEEMATGKALNAINALKSNHNPPYEENPSEYVDIVAGTPGEERVKRIYPRDEQDTGYRKPYNRDSSYRKPYNVDGSYKKPYERNYSIPTTRYNPALAEVATPVAYPEYKSATSLDELLEKLAASEETKRILIERVIRPAVGTSASLLTLAGISRLVGRNLYGGMEQVRKDEDVKYNGRIVIDIPTSDINDPKRAIIKAASTQDAVSKLSKIKAALDAKIVNGPKAIRMLDKLLAQQEAVKYKGKTGLAHLVTEEIPFKAIEGMSYAVPMVAVGTLTGRNIKRAFEPIVANPNVTTPEGITRITIEENRGKDKKKISKIAEVVDPETAKMLAYYDPALAAAKDIKLPTQPYVTNNLKKLKGLVL